VVELAERMAESSGSPRNAKRLADLAAALGSPLEIPAVNEESP
jgi:hypothetical protein